MHHNNILKSLFFFGSIQLFQTVISLIKVKYVSVLIGPSGMGELTLFTTFSNTIVYIVGFGLFNSAVRDISIAKESNDLFEIRKIFNLVNKILLITLIIASCSIFIFEIQIGRLLLGETASQFYNFNLLIPVVLFSVFASRNNMLIQGMGEYKNFGKVALFSSLFSLFAIFPLFYFYGKTAIIFSLIISAFILYVVSEYYRRPLNINTNFDLNFTNLYADSSQLIKLGVIMMISSLLGNVVTNLINIFIVKSGSSFDLGLYNAAITLSLQYVSLVFVSLSSEFYPRLSSISHNYNEVRNMVNNQIEVVLVILLPLLVMMQVFATSIVKIVFTADFFPIIPFIQLSTIAIIFQALAYVISNIPLAMGNKKFLFLYNSLLPGLISLISSILGYKFFGLLGLVYALYIVNIIHFVSMYLVVKRAYNFYIFNHIIKLIVLVLLILSISLFSVLISDGYLYNLLILCIIGFTFYITYKKCVQLFGFNFSSFFTQVTKVFFKG
jgi:O-antigen/teichoic acid export membrane protein